MLPVNLTESRTIWKTVLWASMDGNQSFNSLIGVRSPIYCAWHHFLAGVHDCVHGEREMRVNVLPSLSISCLPGQCEQSSQPLPL